MNNRKEDDYISDNQDNQDYENFSEVIPSQKQHKLLDEFLQDQKLINTLIVHKENPKRSKHIINSLCTNSETQISEIDYPSSFKNCVDKIKEFLKTNKSLQEDLYSKNIKIKQLNKQIEQFKKDQQKSKTIQCIYLRELISEFQSMQKKINDQETLIKQYESLVEQNLSAIKSLDLGKQINNTFQTQGDSKQYDIQIDYRSLSELIQGVKIHCHSHSRKYIKENHDAGKFIGILGNFNTGKTFILSALTGKKLPQGLNQQTEGFNIVTEEKNGNTNYYFDTAGTGETVQLTKKLCELKTQLEFIQKDIEIEDQKGKQQSDIRLQALKEEQKNKFNQIETEKQYISQNKEYLMQQQTLSEKFLQSYIFENCHLIILVVGVMNREDEKMIAFVCNQLKQKQFQIEIIIIHNYQQLATIKGVQNKVQKDILNCFQVNEENYDIGSGKMEETVQIYRENFNTGTNIQKSIYHVVMALNNTEAGTFYNEKSLQFIKKKIAEIEQKDIQINLLKSLQNFFNTRLDGFIKEKDSQYVGQQQIFKFEIENDENQNNALIMKSKAQKKFEVRQFLFDHFGNRAYEKGVNTPKFDVWSNTKQIVINIEIPGINKDSIKPKINNDKLINENALEISLTVDRQKLQLQEDLQKLETIDSNILYGIQEFKSVVYWPAAEIDESTLKWDLKDGVLSITFQKQQDEEEFEIKF